MNKCQSFISHYCRITHIRIHNWVEAFPDSKHEGKITSNFIGKDNLY